MFIINAVFRKMFSDIRIDAKKNKKFKLKIKKEQLEGKQEATYWNYLYLSRIIDITNIKKWIKNDNINAKSLIDIAKLSIIFVKM